MRQWISAWPSHFPMVMAFFGVMALLAAFAMWRTRTVRSRIRHSTRRVTALEMGVARLVSVFAGLLGVCILALAAWAWRLHEASGFEQLMDAIGQDDVTQVRSLLATRDRAIVNYARGEGGGRRGRKAGPAPVTFPLLVAVQRRQPEIVRLLLEHGADVHRLNERQESPLLFAVDRDTTLMKLLLDAGMPVGGRTRDGKSGMLLAVATGDVAPVELLLEHGATVNDAGTDNTSPLHVVTSPEVAALLCAHDAHPRWPDANNALPDARARQRGDAAMAAFLSSESGPCIWLHTRPGVASKASRETAVNEYYCEQLKAEPADRSQAERRARQAAACLALARALETGDDELQADPARAQTAYALACQNGRAEACAPATGSGAVSNDRRR